MQDFRASKLDLRWGGSAQEAVVRLQWHPSQPLLFTGCLDGVARCWDARTGACMHEYRGHGDEILDLAVSASACCLGADAYHLPFFLFIYSAM